MVDAQYEDHDLANVEVRYSVTLDQADLDALANGETVTAQVTLNGVVDIDAEFDDLIGGADD